MIDCDILIAGSGIAGLTAALTAVRVGRSTMVLTGATLGGQLLSINKIDGYPGFPDGVPGYDLCPSAQEQATAAGAVLKMTDLVDLDYGDGTWRGRLGDGSAIEAHAVIVATGARLKKLGVPGEERLFGRGVSHCASCDAPLLKGRTVVVVGGGDFRLAGGVDPGRAIDARRRGASRYRPNRAEGLSGRRRGAKQDRIARRKHSG